MSKDECPHWHLFSPTYQRMYFKWHGIAAFLDEIGFPRPKGGWSPSKIKWLVNKRGLPAAPIGQLRAWGPAILMWLSVGHSTEKVPRMWGAGRWPRESH